MGVGEWRWTGTLQNDDKSSARQPVLSPDQPPLQKQNDEKSKTTARPLQRGIFKLLIVYR